MEHEYVFLPMYSWVCHTKRRTPLISRDDITEDIGDFILHKQTFLK